MIVCALIHYVIELIYDTIREESTDEIALKIADLFEYLDSAFLVSAFIAITIKAISDTWGVMAYSRVVNEDAANKSLWVGTYFINIKEGFTIRGLSLRDILEIPPPITEQNKDEYLEELSQIKRSEDWIKKHSVENESEINENKIVQNHKTSDTQVFSNFFEALFEILGPIVFFFIVLPIIAIFLFCIMLFLEFPNGIRSFPFGWNRDYETCNV